MRTRPRASRRSTLLLGARHNYPATTRVRVSLTACGYTERWSPAARALDQLQLLRRHRRRPHDRLAHRLPRVHRLSGFAALPLRRRSDPTACLGPRRRPLDQPLQGRDDQPDRARQGRRPRDDRRCRHANRDRAPAISSRSTGKATGDNTNESWLAQVERPAGAASRGRRGPHQDDRRQGRIAGALQAPPQVEQADRPRRPRPASARRDARRSRSSAWREERRAPDLLLPRGSCSAP